MVGNDTGAIAYFPIGSRQGDKFHAEAFNDAGVVAAIRNAAPALIALAKRPKWLCYTCGFETSDEAEAQAHFGDGDGSPAICRWWYEEADEATRLRAYQDEVIETAGAREAEYQATQRAEKAEAEASAQCENAAMWEQQFMQADMRREDAEAERDRYREMAVRMADELSDVEYQELGAGRLAILKEPDIAALLEENSHG